MDKGVSISNLRPGVGIAVFVTSTKYPNHLILGKRLGKVGSGLYQLPGGHLELGESWEETACREVLEETGLTIHHTKFCTAVNTVKLEHGYHYVTIFMKAEIGEDAITEPQNMEPEKCEGWKWVEWNNIPPAEKLFWPLKSFVDLKQNPFEY